MNRIVRRSADVYQVKLPLPFPLRWVNGYAVRGEDGWTVIDPGLRTPETEAAWADAMRTIGFGFGDVVRIVLTHHHPDHYGMAGWLQERTGAPVYLSPTGLRQAERLWGPGTPMTDAMIDLFRRHGMDEPALREMRAHMDDFVSLVSPQPSVTPLEPDERVRIGDRDCLAIETPGHAAGHLCLYDEANGAVFCGDHVLPQITRNVSYLPGIDDDPLRSYLDSLAAVRELRVDIAYPGHRDPFAGFADRAEEIIAHHERRLRAMEDMLAEPLTSFQVCRQMFGERLTVHQLRFAMAETIAHLVYLEREGRLSVDISRGAIAYRSVRSAER